MTDTYIRGDIAKICKKNVLTMGDVGKLCSVAPRTVSKWCDKGMLKSWRIPASKARRVHRRDLIAFMRENFIPMVGPGWDDYYTTLIISPMPQIMQSLDALLGPGANGTSIYRLVSVPTTFAAGMETVLKMPDAVIVDFALGSNEAFHTASYLRGKGNYANTQIIGITNEDGPCIPDPSDFDFVFQRPFDPHLLAEILRAWAKERDE